MINNFDQLIHEAKKIAHCKKQAFRVAVAAGDDKAAIEAIREAKEMGLADAVLVGEKKLILETLDALDIQPDEFEIIHAEGESEICRQTIQIIKSGQADLILKGKIKSATLLKAILNKECGLRTGKLISDAYLFEWPNRPSENKLMIITDGGFNLTPDLEQKIQIIENAVHVAHALGNENPKVAVLSAVETVNPALPATIDAAVLTKMNERGQITGCLIDGPLALDNAVSEEAAKIKNLHSPVAGKADILLFPGIESANLTAKATLYFSNFRLAHATMGAQVPVLIPSRAESADAKLCTLALNVILAEHSKRQ